MPIPPHPDLPFPYPEIAVDIHPLCASMTSLRGVFHSFASVRRVSTHILPVFALAAVVHAKLPLSGGPALFPVEVGGKYGYIDSTGRTVIAPQFDDARQFRDSRAFVDVEGRWGIVDAEGAWVKRPQYHEGSFFSSGLAAVNTGPRAWLIDHSGKPVGRQFQQIISLFDEGLALIEDTNG